MVRAKSQTNHFVRFVRNLVIAKKNISTLTTFPLFACRKRRKIISSTTTREHVQNAKIEKYTPFTSPYLDYQGLTMTVVPVMRPLCLQFQGLTMGHLERTPISLRFQGVKKENPGTTRAPPTSRGQKKSTEVNHHPRMAPPPR